VRTSAGARGDISTTDAISYSSFLLSACLAVTAIFSIRYHAGVIRIRSCSTSNLSLSDLLLSVCG
jgi:hypothetical protein